MPRFSRIRAAFPREPAQEVQLRAPDATFAQQSDFRRSGVRAAGKMRLHANTSRDLPDGERLVDAAAAPGDADALERLKAPLSHPRARAP